ERLTRGDQGGVAEPDIAFHRELVRLSDHRRLLVAWEALAPTAKTLLTIADTVYADMPWAVDQHQQIVDALRAGREGELERLVRRALDAGATLFDTAPAYGGGHGETLLGRALRGKRHEAFVVTKGGLVLEGGRVVGRDSSHRALTAGLDGSLRRLRADYVDLF